MFITTLLLTAVTLFIAQIWIILLLVGLWFIISVYQWSIRGILWEVCLNRALLLLLQKSWVGSIYIVGNKPKGQISKWVFEENKARQIFWKTNIPDSLICACAYQGVRNVRFSENLACFVFLKHPFWDSPFCLITNNMYITVRCAIWYQLYSFKNVKSTHGGVLLLVKLQAFSK